MLIQEEKVQLVDVAIPLPINDPYTYRVPQNLAGQLQVGCRVRVPFKNRTIIGYSVALDSEREVQKPKDILEVLDSKPVLSDHFLRLTKWISEHYFSSWGEAISNVIPRYLKEAKSETFLEHPFKEIESEFHLNAEQEAASSRIKERILENRFREIFLFPRTWLSPRDVLACHQTQLF